ncbi:DNA-3-methyladenine glycosylase [Leucobacter triazinivorans]|uniref:Putative 3-methyladenine DNA glycosylase n=1 Tax=Leucobacter triazinivorans TaxID=1784719 RepID=A0A4P6KBJ4_9MICO|nr:DNA-3-methyladenine glycosylase [Leucobacter triazinivorans]QBE47463.1 DNA-3-methyladenine glycosylase [Leucobacter triazinivorans]
MTRELFLSPALEVAPRLLEALLTVAAPEGDVTIRITEVEAYHGVGTDGPYDAGSHAKDRRTERNASMFGPPGHAYVYFSYGMHFALNMVCSPEGAASGVLIRAGEVVSGAGLAHERRSAKRGAPIDARMLARGPGNLAAALGVRRDTHDGRDLFAPPFALRLPDETERRPRGDVMNGPRVGVAGEAGGPAFPWRFWIAGDPTVSAFRPGRGAQPFIAERHPASRLSPSSRRRDASSP